MGSDLTYPDPCKSVFLWAGTEEASFTISVISLVKFLKMLQLWELGSQLLGKKKQKFSVNISWWKYTK